MSNTNEFATLLNNVRGQKPLVHHITNYVTVNDCANITLAIGASPIMADSIEEAGDIAAMAQALVLNIGTLNERTIPSLLAAGKAANSEGVPVVFDPVGAGASRLRNETTAKILDEVKVAVLRGNISEVRFISGLGAHTKGVDAAESDTADDAGPIARQLAARLGCVVAITGAIDAVSDGSRVVRIHNGHAALGSITGTGCMCSSLVGAYCGASQNTFAAAVAALLSMGIAGEIAFEAAGAKGNGSFHMALLDAISLLTPAILQERARYDETQS